MNNLNRYNKLVGGAPRDLSSIPSEFIMHRDGSLSVVWAPLDHININARIAIIGITSGWQQASIAYKTAEQALKDGLGYLFRKPHPDLHTTSALRYPVFYNNKNYTGHTPSPLKNNGSTGIDVVILFPRV